jgi:hypothetical protein
VIDRYDPLKMDYQQFRALVEGIKVRLNLDNDDPVPLSGTDVTGLGQHQYFRLAIVSTRDARPRSFMLFVESEWLVGKCHEMLGSPDWMRDGHWDNHWNYIEEILHRPGVGEELGQYSRMIPDTENHVWVAIYEFLRDQGVLNSSAKKIFSRTYGLPQEDR